MYQSKYRKTASHRTEFIQQDRHTLDFKKWCRFAAFRGLFYFCR